MVACLLSLFGGSIIGRLYWTTPALIYYFFIMASIIIMASVLAKNENYTFGLLLLSLFTYWIMLEDSLLIVTGGWNKLTSRHDHLYCATKFYFDPLAMVFIIILLLV